MSSSVATIGKAKVKRGHAGAMSYFHLAQKVSEPQSSQPPYTMELTTNLLMLSQVTTPD